MTPEALAQLEARQEEQKNMVKEFIRVFKQKPNAALQANLIIEEAGEVFEAAHTLRADNTVENMAAYLKECGDYLYVLVGLLAVTDLVGTETAQEQLNSEADLGLTLEITNQLAVSLIDGSYNVFMDDDIAHEVFTRIHASNMSKVDDEGEPIFDERGKVMKGPNYQAPDLTDLATVCSNKYDLHMAALALDTEEFDEDIAA